MKSVSFTVDLEGADEEVCRNVIALMQSPTECELVFTIKELGDDQDETLRFVRVKAGS